MKKIGWIVSSSYRGLFVDRTLDREIETAAGFRTPNKTFSGRGVRVLQFDVRSRVEAEALARRIKGAGFKARYSPGRNALDSELTDWNWTTNRPNPLSLQNKKTLMIAGGVVGLAAIGYAIYSATKTPASGGNAIVTTTPNNPPSSGGGGGTVTVGPITAIVTITDADAGKTFSMNVGDTLNVVLPTNGSVAGYTQATSGDNVLASTSTSNANGSTTISYKATAAGTETLDFASTDLTGNIVLTIPILEYKIVVGTQPGA